MVVQHFTLEILNLLTKPTIFTPDFRLLLVMLSSVIHIAFVKVVFSENIGISKQFIVLSTHAHN